MQYPRVVVVLFAIGLLPGCKKDSDKKLAERFEIPAGGYPVTVEASGSGAVDALVRQLVSRRPAPYPSGYSDPPDAVTVSGIYCTPEVGAAIKSLKEMGPTVFPALVKHLGDDRYSYSGVVAAWGNYNVGAASVEVLCDAHY